MNESSECRADKENTALNIDSKGTLESSITQYQEYVTESSESRADKENTALNDDSKNTPDSSITQYEEFTTESSENRADMVKECTAMNDSNGTLETCRSGRDTTNWSIRVDEEGNIRFRPRSEFRSSGRRPRHKQWGWW